MTETPHEEPVFGEDPPQAKTLFGNKLYDRLKFIAQVVLPALATFYITLGDLWGFPKTQEVAGTIVAVDLLLGLILGLSTRQYENSGAKYAGAVHLTNRVAPDGETTLTEVGIGFAPGVDGETLEKSKEVTLRVVRD